MEVSNRVVINQEDVDEHINEIEKTIENKYAFLNENFHVLKEKDQSKLSIEELFIMRNLAQGFRFCPPERLDLYVKIICFYLSLKHFQIPTEEW